MKKIDLHGKHGRGNKNFRRFVKCMIIAMVISLSICSSSVTIVPHSYATGTYEPDVDILVTQAASTASAVKAVAKMGEVGSRMANAVTKIEVKEPVKYFSIPLSEDLQDHILEECEKRSVDPSIIIAMIQRESDFRASCIGDNGNSLGLMQIQPRWHQDRANSLGCPDLMDPYHNVTVGIDLFASLLAYDISVEWALMAYNGGPSYANKKLARGEISDYARYVLRNSQIFEEGRI